MLYLLYASVCIKFWISGCPGKKYNVHAISSFAKNVHGDGIIKYDMVMSHGFDINDRLLELWILIKKSLDY